jgi:hypothetical protein
MRRSAYIAATVLPTGGEHRDLYRMSVYGCDRRDGHHDPEGKWTRLLNKELLTALESLRPWRDQVPAKVTKPELLFVGSSGVLHIHYRVDPIIGTHDLKSVGEVVLNSPDVVSEEQLWLEPCGQRAATVS